MIYELLAEGSEAPRGQPPCRSDHHREIRRLAVRTGLGFFGSPFLACSWVRSFVITGARASRVPSPGVQLRRAVARRASPTEVEKLLGPSSGSGSLGFVTDTADPIEVAASLRVLLAAAHEGELTSTPVGRHWLAGAITALDVAGQPHAQAASPVSENAL